MNTAGRNDLERLLAERFEPETLDGKPILELGARVWPLERYRAFGICYRTMRRVDDLIDLRRAQAAPLIQEEKDRLGNTVREWMLDGNECSAPEVRELGEIRRKFKLPGWPWRRWTKAMLYDLDHNGFATFKTFLRYCEGAAVAPGAVFMHLCGVRQEGGEYRPPDFDIRRAARPLAVFCYLVHIMRDFRADQRQNLNYFADDLLARNGIGNAELRAIAGGAPISPEFRKIMRQYHDWAEYYSAETRICLERVSRRMEPVYRLSLEIVFGLYRRIFAKLDPDAGRFTAEEADLSCAEIQRIIFAGLSAL